MSRYRYCETCGIRLDGTEGTVCVGCIEDVAEALARSPVLAGMTGTWETMGPAEKERWRALASTAIVAVTNLSDRAVITA